MIPVFVHIPRTAGNSVREAISEASVDVVDIGHSTPRRQGTMGDDYFRFCFVRNPYTRLRSAFYHLVEVTEEPNPADSLQIRRLKIRNTYGEDFKKFVLDRAFTKVHIAHFFPQTYWTHRYGKREMSFIGHLERIDSDWKLLGEKLEVDLPLLTRKNATRYPNFKYTPRMRDIVFDSYVRDFVYLEYRRGWSE